MPNGVRGMAERALLGVGAGLLLGCTPAPPLGLATTGSTAIHPAASREPQAGAVEQTRELYDHWGTRWCFGAGAPSAGAPALGPNGQIYVATHEGYVHALDRSGGFLWSYTVKGAIDVPPVVLPGGAVVVATRLNLMYAIRPDGRRLWVYRVPEPVQTSLAVSERGTVVFGAGRFYAYAVSARGGLVWRLKLPGTVTEGPLLHKNGTVFMGTERGVVSWQAPTQLRLWESPRVDGFVLDGAKTSGEQLWLASGRVFSSNGPVELGQDLRFARTLPEGGTLVASRSALRWLGPAGAVLREVVLDAEPSAPPLLGSGGEAWIPSVEGTLLGVAPGESTARAVARLGFGPLSALVPDGVDQLIAASGDGSVCAVSRSRLGPNP